jgi:DNA-directed RNA polymerase subunit H (RpoH/RPB5)
MHILQPKHTKLKDSEKEEILKKFNVSLTQLPKINITDVNLPEGCEISDIIKIERVSLDGSKSEYFRVVSV